MWRFALGQVEPRLARVVSTPAVDDGRGVADCGGRARMAAADGDLACRYSSGQLDPIRRRCVGERAVADLSPVVPSPAVGASVDADRARGAPSGGDAGQPGEGHRLGRRVRKRVDRPGGRVHVVVSAPTGSRAVDDSAGVAVAGRHPGHTVGAGTRTGGGALHRRPVTELAVPVRTPTPQRVGLRLRPWRSPRVIPVVTRTGAAGNATCTALNWSVVVPLGRAVRGRCDPSS